MTVASPLQAVRLPAQHSPRQMCTRCVMDKSATEITFDADGVCSFCRHYETRAANELFVNRPDGAERLARLVEQIKASGRGKDYDCVIGLSGGVDSSYVAYVLRQHGIRPLAIHLDNGWNSELAVNNVERLVKALKIDLMTYVLDWREFRDLQLSFIKASVVNLEIPTDHAIVAILYRMSVKHGLPFIISGSNIVTEAIMPESWGYDNKDWRHIRGLHRLFGTVPLRTFPHLSLLDWARHTFINRVRFIPILNYVPYSRAGAMAELAEHCGWRNYGGKHHESLFTKIFQAYVLPLKYGVDKRRAHYATMINSGQMTRAEALAELEQPAYPPEELREELPYFVRKLGITNAEWEAILATPPKDYTAYPNNATWFKRLNGVVKIAKRMATNT